MSFYNYFRLSAEFSAEDLERAHEAKRQEINNYGISAIEKDILARAMKTYYREAKTELTRRERINNEYNINPWSNPTGIRSWLWDGVDFFDRMERRINRRFDEMRNRTENYTSVQRSYREVTQPDGSSVVIEEASQDLNGEVRNTTRTYRRNADGTEVPIDGNEARRLLGGEELIG